MEKTLVYHKWNTSIGSFKNSIIETCFLLKDDKEKYPRIKLCFVWMCCQLKQLLQWYWYFTNSKLKKQTTLYAMEEESIIYICVYICIIYIYMYIYIYIYIYVYIYIYMYMYIYIFYIYIYIYI